MKTVAPTPLRSLRFMATKVQAEKPYYVTTPIFYVNAGMLNSMAPIPHHIHVLYSL